MDSATDKRAWLCSVNICIIELDSNLVMNAVQTMLAHPRVQNNDRRIDLYGSLGRGPLSCRKKILNLCQTSSSVSDRLQLNVRTKMKREFPMTRCVICKRRFVNHKNRYCANHMQADNSFKKNYEKLGGRS